MIINEEPEIVQEPQQTFDLTEPKVKEQKKKKLKFVQRELIPKKVKQKKVTFTRDLTKVKQRPFTVGDRFYNSLTEYLNEDRKLKPENKWRKLLRKISFDELLPNGMINGGFYEKYNKIRPGYGFYKALIDANKKIPLKFLHGVNIPDFLVTIQNDTHFVYKNDHDQFVVDNGLNLVAKFEKHLLDNMKFDYKEKTWMPIFINRTRDNYDIENSTMRIIVKSYKDLREKKEFSPADYCIRQKFINTRGNVDQDYAQVFRVCYHTRNNQQLRANYGYKLRVSDSYIRSERAKTNVQVLERIQTLQTSRFKSISVSNIKGQALRIYERICSLIVQYFDQAFQIRISRIVLDFMIDKFTNKIYLMNCKSIHLSKNVYTGLQKISDKNLDELTSNVYCKLCGMMFNKNKANKLLTQKLLWELVQHLGKRNQQIEGLHSLKKTTRPVRVCNLCYMLVVAEHELIEVEQRFAQVCNIPIRDPMIRVPQLQEPMHRPPILADNLLQWRLLLLVQTLIDWKLPKGIDDSNLFFQVKVNNTRAAWKLRFRKVQQKTKFSTSIFPAKKTAGVKALKKTVKRWQVKLKGGEIQDNEMTIHTLRFMRLVYFFSQTDNIDTFIQKTHV